MAIVDMESGALTQEEPPRFSLGRREALWGLLFI
jgi:hypothetical protein